MSSERIKKSMELKTQSKSAH